MDRIIYKYVCEKINFLSKPIGCASTSTFINHVMPLPARPRGDIAQDDRRPRGGVRRGRGAAPGHRARRALRGRPRRGDGRRAAHRGPRRRGAALLPVRGHRQQGAVAARHHRLRLRAAAASGRPRLRADVPRHRRAGARGVAALRVACAAAAPADLLTC